MINCTSKICHPIKWFSCFCNFPCLKSCLFLGKNKARERRMLNSLSPKIEKMVRKIPFFMT